MHADDLRARIEAALARAPEDYDPEVYNWCDCGNAGLENHHYDAIDQHADLAALLRECLDVLTPPEDPERIEVDADAYRATYDPEGWASAFERDPPADQRCQVIVPACRAIRHLLAAHADVSEQLERWQLSDRVARRTIVRLGERVKELEGALDAAREQERERCAKLARLHSVDGDYLSRLFRSDAHLEPKP